MLCELCYRWRNDTCSNFSLVLISPSDADFSAERMVNSHQGLHVAKRKAWAILNGEADYFNLLQQLTNLSNEKGMLDRRRGLYHRLVQEEVIQ